MGFEEEAGRFDPKNRRFQARLLKIRVLGPLGWQALTSLEEVEAPRGGPQPRQG